MGVSTDAILVFGIDLVKTGYLKEAGDEPAFFTEQDEEDWDFDKVLMRDAGLAPWGYHENENQREDYKVFSARRKQAQEQAGVELITHCSGDYPMYILAVANVGWCASRGSTIEISKDDMLMNQLVGINKLREFCVRHDIPWSDPKWLLCSYWG